MNFELIFMGDSYTQGWGLWYHYWCKNKLYNQLDLYEKYMDVHAVHSGFIDNEALNFAWSNRFPALVASHFNTNYRTNCWEDVGHFSSYTGFPLSRERVHTAATKLIESYLEYFKKYDNKVRKFFILQTSEVIRDTILGFDYQTKPRNIIKNIINEWKKEEHQQWPDNIRDTVMKLLINSDDGLFYNNIPDAAFPVKLLKEIYPERDDDLFKDENFEKILYKMWELIWGKMQIELKKYNCELLLVHNRDKFCDNVILQNTVRVSDTGSIERLQALETIPDFTVDAEIDSKYNIKILDPHPGLAAHKFIARSIIKHIEDNLL